MKCANPKCCNNVVVISQSSKKYCTSRCKSIHHNSVHRMTNPTIVPEVSSGTKGCIGEFRACIELASRGFHVFRAISQACPCDLVAMRDSMLLRVEVTTVCHRIDGSFSCKKSPNDVKWDVLAMVTRDGTVIFSPPLPEIALTSPQNDGEDQDHENTLVG